MTHRRLGLSVRRAAKGLLALVALLVWSDAGAQAQTASVRPFATLRTPAGAPLWLRSNWHAMLSAPLPRSVGPTPGMPATLPATTSDPDPTGLVGTYQPNGATATASNAFFQPLGTNGRGCVTCHSPPNGMSLSANAIQAQYSTYGANTPLFAPVDGATCPSNVSASNTAAPPIGGSPAGSPASNVSPYLLLLTKGLFRIPLPVPKTADFTIAVSHDPYGCNTAAQFTQMTDPGTGAVSQMVSLYRRPLMAANLKFKTVTAADTGLFSSKGLTPDPFSGLPESGNIMWDGREATLQSQATDATLGHAQALAAPTAAQVAQIVAFETGVYAAQIYDTTALDLTSGGALPTMANGGPVMVAKTAPGTTTPGVGTSTFSIYAQPSTNSSNPAVLQRASIVRGQTLFDTKTFQASNVAGFNDIPGVGNPATVTCSGCHHQINAGTDAAPKAAFDLGVGGSSQAFNGPAPAPDLPVFTIVCKAGATTSFHNGTVITNDPGVGLISGKCADVGKFIVPGLRALVARAPYFHDGSAATLADVVTFYDTRFRIGLSTQDKQDLVNFLGAL